VSVNTKNEKDYRSLGEILRDCREQRNLSVEDVSEATKISPRVLNSLEADGVGELAGPLYVRSFVKTLAAFYEQEEAWLLTRLETLDQAATRPVPPVNLRPHDAGTPVPAPKTAIPEPPREVTTWRVETVDDTTVKRIEGKTAMPASRWWWIVAAIIVALLALWIFRGGDSQSKQSNRSVSGNELLTQAAETGAESPRNETTANGKETLDTGMPGNREETGQQDRATVVVQDRVSRLSNAVPEPGKPAVDLDHAILAGADPSAERRGNPTSTNPPSTNAPPERADSGQGPDQAAPAPETKSPSQDEAATSTQADSTPTKEDAGDQKQAPANIQEPTADDQPSKADEGESQARSPQTSKSMQRLGSIVRPGLKPPVAGELSLDLRANRVTEVRVSVDGAIPQRRSLQAGETWHLTARDHFSLFLEDPSALAVQLNGKTRTPPAGLDGGEWLLYPLDESQ
jgi:cytoskeletal protein RodZ